VQFVRICNHEIVEVGTDLTSMYESDGTVLLDKSEQVTAETDYADIDPAAMLRVTCDHMDPQRGDTFERKYDIIQYSNARELVFTPYDPPDVKGLGKSTRANLMAFIRARHVQSFDELDRTEAIKHVSGFGPRLYERIENHELFGGL